MSGQGDEISLEETNRIRASLGLAPLADPSATAATGDAPPQTEEDVAVANFKKVKDQADAERAAQALQQRLDKARNQKELRSKLSGKGLGEAEDAAAQGARVWVKKSRKTAAATQAELARKRMLEQAELDRELQAKYDESSLAGLRVAHDLEAFKEGEQETILTLKDARILDGDDDELVNVNLADQERLEERLDLKKKGSKVGQYTGYDDAEFATGERSGLLAKYDLDGSKPSVGFRLGEVARRNDDDGATGFEAVAKSAVKDKQEVAKELQRTLADLNYSKNVEVSDYLQEGDAGFKKAKKKKKASKSSRRMQADEPDADADEMQVDEPVRVSLEDLEAQALVDDEELQAALARQRRAMNRQALSALKRNAELAAAEEASSAMETDGLDPPLAIKEEEADDDESGLVLDATSEFVRGIQLQPIEPKKSASVAPVPPPPAPPAKAEGDQPLAELDTDMQPTNGVDDEQDALEEGAAQEGDGLEGTAAEMHVGRGIGSTLSLLRQQGLLKPLTDEERQQDAEWKQKQAWLNQRRADELRILEQKAASRAAGASKDQRTREIENRQREREQAQRDIERFKDYKPNVDIKYNDEFGREMTSKEAWKFLSHRFHGKGSGIKAQEKRLKKIADERKREAMVSGDTPLSSNAAFQARQEKLGSATMILSVGNKMTAPGLEDFQTTGGLDPAKASASKGKKKKGGPQPQEPEFNLTPTLNVPVAPPVASTSASPAPEAAPKRAGFQRINKRPAAEQDGAEAKRLKPDAS